LHPQPCELLEPDQARRQPTPADAVRRILAEDGRSTEPERVGDVRTVTVPGPGGALPVRVYHPTGTATGAPLPVLLWAHGGWVLFNAETYDASCRGLVNKTGAIVVTPEYRRAPEHPFPAAYDDVAATWRWLREHAAELGGDPARVAVGGESVGATMAVATACQLARAGAVRPVALVLVCPLTTVAQVGASMADAADARPLSRPVLSWVLMHAFHGAPAACTDPRVDLLSLPPDQLRGLPPTLVVTAERDVLRSQGEEFARRLAAAGVSTRLERYDGVMHEFFGAAAVLDAADRAQWTAAESLCRAFGSRRPVAR
jgi:acetyl esterase/lipase